MIDDRETEAPYVANPFLGGFPMIEPSPAPTGPVMDPASGSGGATAEPQSHTDDSTSIGDRSEGASAAPTLVGISSVDLRRSAEKLASCSSGLLVPHFVTHQAPSPSFAFLHRACPLLCAGLHSHDLQWVHSGVLRDNSHSSRALGLGRGDWEPATTGRVCDFVIAKAGRHELGITDMSFPGTPGRIGKAIDGVRRFGHRFVERVTVGSFRVSGRRAGRRFPTSHGLPGAASESDRPNCAGLQSPTNHRDLTGLILRRPRFS
ncbi:hypothetical protein CMUS01_08495 [Colletotrichum musicola]|uniref:Uncharacterized protein n=1 Tax=Colletotrichum musicola TaxID=2175873 RepID=A0A8H6NDJ1_9PEZI|nr:hypothetical protein CMUS01_08495 [Colletotrichum musicola]